MPPILALERYTATLRADLPGIAAELAPWHVIRRLDALIGELIRRADPAMFRLNDGNCIHRRATVEAGATIKRPAYVAADAFVAAHAYIRGNVFVGERCHVGPGSEVKQSIVLAETRLAHFNYVGDSIIGRDVNLEAGAVIANHFNERADKTISVAVDGVRISTGMTKFGALVGDGCRIGANAVLSPGTLLAPGAVIGRLELVRQTD